MKRVVIEASKLKTTSSLLEKLNELMTSIAEDSFSESKTSHGCYNDGEGRLVFDIQYKESDIISPNHIAYTQEGKLLRTAIEYIMTYKDYKSAEEVIDLLKRISNNKEELS